MVAALFLCPPAGASDFSVKVNRGRLSVKANSARFGPLMDKIAKEAGFEISLSPDVAAKRLSTDFMDLDMERGIQRLMGLIRHRNFFMYYGRDGSIKKIEIYGAGRGTRGSTGRPPSHPGGPGQGVAPLIMDPPANSDNKSGSSGYKRDLKTAPYIPPAAIPEYIPPRRGIGSRGSK
jgi:hypothetical protein